MQGRNKMSMSDESSVTSSTSYSSLQSGYTAASSQSGSISSTKKRSKNKSSENESHPSPAPDTRLNVLIQVKACRNLPFNKSSVSAAFVQVNLGNTSLHKTLPIYHDENPKFSAAQDHSFSLTCTVQELLDAQGLMFLIMNKDFIMGEEEVCKVRIPPKVFYNPTGELREFKMKQCKKEGSGAVTKQPKGIKSYIRLRMRHVATVKSPNITMAVTDNKNNNTMPQKPPQPQPQPKNSPITTTQTKKTIPSELGYDTNYQQALAKKITSGSGNDTGTANNNEHKDFYNKSRPKKNPPLTIEIVSSTRKVIEPEVEKIASDVYTRVTIDGEDLTQALISFKSARHKAPLFESVVFYNLNISNTKEDMILADEIKEHKNLRKAHFFHLQILSNTNSKTSMIPPILESVGELPLLEELEIRIEGERKELPKIFLKYICQFSKSMKSLLLANVLLTDENMKMLFCPKSSKLESLVLWNIGIDFKQLRLICDDLYTNTTMKRLEIWCSELGNNFGILLAEMLEANKSLETMVISHVGMYGASCIALMDALKTKNSTLRNLTLLSIAYNDRDTVSKAVMQMMNDNKTLKSLAVTYEAMKEEDCLLLSKDIKRNMLLCKLLQHKKELEEKKNLCEIL